MINTNRYNEYTKGYSTGGFPFFQNSIALDHYQYV